MKPSNDVDKAPAEESAPKLITRLENMDVSFVSLVTAGANRQKAFMIIKAITCPGCDAQIDPVDGRCPECGIEIEVEIEQKASNADRASADEAATNDKDGLSTSSKKDGPESTSEENMGKQSATPSEPNTPAAAMSADFVAKLADASQVIAQAIAEVAFEKAAAAEAPALEEPPAASSPAPAPEETAKSAQREDIAKALAEREQELSVMRTELDKARLAKVAAEARAQALRATVGSGFALPTGEVAKASDPKKAAPRKLWASDMNTIRVNQEKHNV